MNVLSLFDGIACGRVALERANIKVDKYYSSEIDKNAIEISEKNYKDIIRLGDITKISKEDIESMGKIDLVLAGSPCQGFSRQGKGLNFDDPRSKLFFNFMEILEWVRGINPNVKFLLENVHMKKEWVQVIDSYLGAKAIDINSKLVSAQNRPRLYWTNIEGIEIPKDKNISLLDILEHDKQFIFKQHQGVMIDHTFNDKELSLINVVNGEVRILQATKKGYIVANNGDGINLSFPTSSTRRGRVVNQKTNTLDRSCNACVYYNGVLRKLTLTELERLQTLKDGYTEGPADRHRKATIGNGWTIDVISHILSYMKIEKDIDTDFREDGNEQFKWIL